MITDKHESVAVKHVEKFLKKKEYTAFVIGKTNQKGIDDLECRYINDGYTYFEAFYNALIPHIDSILAEFSKKYYVDSRFEIKNDCNAGYRDATYLFIALKYNVKHIEELN